MVKVLHRARDRGNVPPRTARAIPGDFRLALLTGGLALVCLVVVGGSGGIHARELHSRLLAAGGALLFLILAGLSIRSTANETLRILSPRLGSVHASIIRRTIVLGGTVTVLLATLGLLAAGLREGSGKCRKADA